MLLHTQTHRCLVTGNAIKITNAVTMFQQAHITSCFLTDTCTPKKEHTKGGKKKKEDKKGGHSTDMSQSQTPVTNLQCLRMLPRRGVNVGLEWALQVRPLQRLSCSALKHHASHPCLELHSALHTKVSLSGPPI